MIRNEKRKIGERWPISSKRNKVDVGYREPRKFFRLLFYAPLGGRKENVGKSIYKQFI